MLEAAMIKLGAAAVRTAAKLWLGDHAVASDVTASAIDILSDRLGSLRDRRRLARTMDNFADAVAERIAPIVEKEFPKMPENERLAALCLVEDTFSRASLKDADLFASDLDAGHLDRAVRKRAPAQTRDLSADATFFYDLLLRECCGYIIEIARGLPSFGPAALTELLRRDTEILEGIRDVLSRLPQRGHGAGFDYDYRQLVARTLDHAELFGVTASDASRRYPLSVAYISLSAASNTGEILTQGRRVETLLPGDRRLFIRGEAGLGKTTLLQWIAVRSALNDFTGALSPWNNQAIPFFLPLRRYARRQLPAPERFLDEIGRHIADEMPDRWVHDRMRDGKGLLLIDGVDELPADRREDVRKWLRELVKAFPKARYILTSRPSAAQPTWLESERFTVLDLQPMSPKDIEIFIQRWHSAMRSQCRDDDERAELDEFQQSLISRIAARGHLRKLARYPLLCALLCALNRDRRAVLPNNRMELYDVALQMLLERLDAERNISALEGVGRAEKLVLLSDLAYWLIRNDLSDADVKRVIAQFKRRLASMPRITHGAETVFRHLLDRTGLLRKPVEDRVDFIHRTFQEYLAARNAMLYADDIGMLLNNASRDQWHEVIVMAAGHASSRQRRELLQGLIDRGDNEPDKRETLHLLAMASLETAPELDKDLWHSIEQRAEQLVPPRSVTSARSLATAGAFVLDLLAAANPVEQDEVVATIRAAAETGLAEALPVIARFHGDTRLAVQQELLHNWPVFDFDDYAREVLFDLPLSWINIDDPRMLAASRHIRNLRDIQCSNANIVEMADIPDQTTKLRLEARGPVDLSRLRGRKLHEIQIDSKLGTVDIDFSPLADNDELEVLLLSNVRLQTLSTLNGCPLRRLHLRSVTEYEIASVSATWNLDELNLTRALDLTTLNRINLATEVSGLNFRDCADLSWLNGITRWADTLTQLSILDCENIELEAAETVAILLSLHKLKCLEIRSRRPFDHDWLRDQLAPLPVIINGVDR